MGALPQALEIIFQVRRKWSNEKMTRKISFPINKTCFFLFFLFLFGPFLLSNLMTFLFLIHFKQFKVLLECHSKFYKSFLKSNSNITYKEFFGCLRIGLCSVQWFVFLSFLTPFILGDCNFLISNPFVNVLNVPRRGLQVLFGHQKQQNPPLDLAYLNCLSVRSLASFP